MSHTPEDTGVPPAGAQIPDPPAGPQAPGEPVEPQAPGEPGDAGTKADAETDFEGPRRRARREREERRTAQARARAIEDARREWVRLAAKLTWTPP